MKGFFDNGGQRLYVKRVFARPDPAAPARSPRTNARARASRLRRCRRGLGRRRYGSTHLFGIEDGTQLNLFNGGDHGRRRHPDTVASYDGAGTVTLDAPLATDLAPAETSRVSRRAALPPPAANETMRFDAKSRGDWGDT